MPRDPSEKLVFIAGGIGVTPFRSMIKYLIDKNQKRDIVMLYANKTVSDIAYKDFFDRAALAPLGLKTVYTVDASPAVPAQWTGYTGYINIQMIQKEIPDFKDRTFYISGSNGMVKATEQVLTNLGVRNRQIKKDFFPGFA